MSTEQEHHDHVPVYVKLAVFLGVLTGAEVMVLWFAIPDWLMYFALFGMAAVKFGFVVAVFMHLKYDNKMLTGIFFSGFTVALATMVAMIALISYQPSKVAINVRDSKQLAALNAGNPENGPSVFIGKGCAACHAIDGLDGAVGAVGPKLTGLGERAATRVAGQSAADYIRTSIENPNAYIVDGYSAGLMPGNLKGSMSADEYKDLVAYLETL